MRLLQREARETGICPVRRELYTQCFGLYLPFRIIFIDILSYEDIGFTNNLIAIVVNKIKINLNNSSISLQAEQFIGKGS